MKELTTAQHYDCCRDTLGWCTSAVRSKDDEELLYDLYEQFDIGATSSLHDSTLSRLHRDGYIDDEMVVLSRQARQLWFFLSSREWSIPAIKSDPEWQTLFR